MAKVWAILNPISGRRSMAGVVRRLKTELAAADMRLKVRETSGPGDATRLAASMPETLHAVVSVGGDGTLREVVEGLVGRRIPIVVLPSGTENVLAKHFGFRPDARLAAQTILRGRPVEYDVGVCGSRKFVLMVGAGVDADVVRRLAAARTGHISYLSYVAPGLTTLRKYRYPAVRVEVDGEEVYTGRASVWAGVMPRYSLGVSILDRAETDDGLLDVCILPCDSRRRVLRSAVSLLLRGNLRRLGIVYAQGRRVRLLPATDESVPVQIDGDSAGRLPVECSIIQRGVRFLLPPKK